MGNLTERMFGGGSDPQNGDEISSALAALERTAAAGLAISGSETSEIWQSETSEVAGLARPSKPGAGPTKGPLGFVRTKPLGCFLDRSTTPAWARGMALFRTIGPLSDRFGISYWIDLVRPLHHSLEIVRGPGQEPIAFVSAASVNLIHAGNRTTITFGPGSVWLVASLMDNAAPANGYAGIAFSQATMVVPGNQQPPILSGPLILGPAVTADWRFVPVPTTAYSGQLQNDGSSAVANLPAHIDLVLSPDGIDIPVLPDAGLAVCGFTESFSAGAVSVSFDPDLEEMSVAYKALPTPQTFSVSDSKSPTLRLSGSAPAVFGAYRIPVAVTTPAALGAAAGGGAMAISLAPGLNGSFGNVNGAVAFDQTLLHVGTGALTVAARSAVRPFTDTYALWDARASSAAPPMASSISLMGLRGATVLAQESSLGEILVISGCRMKGNLDRPLLTSGGAPNLEQLAITYGLVKTPTTTALVVEGTASTNPTPARTMSYALENGLLRTRGVTGLILVADLVGKRGTSGILLMGHDLVGVTPTLPDPYASYRVGGDVVTGKSLFGSVSWKMPSDPRTAFSTDQLPFEPLDSNGTLHADFITGGSIASSAKASVGPITALFDVSSIANQFGVAVTARAQPAWQIVGQRLSISGAESALFTVPSIAWEPVLGIDRQFFFPVALDDGGATTVSVPSVTLRPLAPNSYIDGLIADYATGADLVAQITLPFGLKARIDTRTQFNNTPPVPRPTLGLAQPQFPADQRSGGRQLRVDAFPYYYESYRVMPGFSNAGGFLPPGPPPPPPGPADSEYVHDILDDTPSHDIANFWNQDFAGDPQKSPATHFVPLSRYDLSGYGASTFSDFRPGGTASGISEARFDVIVGRTVYELVQAQSFILPWCIPVVNTTIFERDPSGYVLRHNSGWQAKGPGRFEFDQIGNADIEFGGIQGVFNVHNIVEAAGTFTYGGSTFTRVRFDADVYLTVGAPDGLTVSGGDPAGHLPSGGLSGYLELSASKLPQLNDALGLIDAYGAATGPIAAEVSVFGTGILMGLTGVEATATRADVARPSGPPRTIAVALRGTPRLPRDGSWSIGVRATSGNVPQPVPPTTPVPLVRARANPGDWHIAEGSDVVALDAPLTAYGYLQATGANKVFFEHPVVSNVVGANPLNFQQSPKLADVGKLLGDGGLLPDILSLVDFGAFDGLAPSGDGLALGKRLENDVDLGKRVLIPLTPIRLLMASWKEPPGSATPTHIALDLDPAAIPRWKIQISNVAFLLAIDGWGGDADPLITVHGDFTAADGSAPTVANLQIKYGSALSIVQTILTEIEKLLVFLPGGKTSGLQVSFSGTKLRIRENFPIPKLPLGVGYIEDVSLNLGFDVDVLQKQMGFFVGLGDDQTPFHWLVSPLSGNGMLQLGASDKLGVVMEAGIGVGLAIDFAIVSGSASIVIAVKLDATRNPIGVMVLLTGQASVDVLDGLASASLSLTAGVGIAVSPGNPKLLLEVPPDAIEFLKETVVTLSAEVAVGIHISVCWLVHIDFDGSWPFSETISGRTLTDLV